MAAERAAEALAGDLESRATWPSSPGREYRGEYVCDFTVAPGTDVPDPVTHLTFGYATQVVILDDDGRLERVVAAHDVGRAINPLACAGQIEGAVHMGLGYALSEELPVRRRACRDACRLRDLGILAAADTPPVEVDPRRGPGPGRRLRRQGVGEIGLVPTAGAVAGALFAIRRQMAECAPHERFRGGSAVAPQVPPSLMQKSKVKSQKSPPTRIDLLRFSPARPGSRVTGGRQGR